jgi:glutaminyl-tRNA synthetase
LCPEKSSPIKATVRVFNPLFTSDSPDTHPGGFLSIVNPRSEETFPNAMIETGFEEIRRRAPWPRLEGERKEEGALEEARPETVRFQGMRVAYFCVDRDRDEERGKVVLNRIVSLKEDPKKV